MPISNVTDFEDAISRRVFDPYRRQLNLFGEMWEREPRYGGVKRRVLERYFGGLTGRERQWAKEFFPACVWCGARNDLTLDHVRPLVKGHALRPGNVVRLCRSCNSFKGDHSLDWLPGDRVRAILNAAAAFQVYCLARSCPLFIRRFGLEVDRRPDWAPDVDG